jgi:cytochrome c553
MIRAALVLVLLPLGRGLHAQQVDPKGVEFYEKKIRPLLVERCYECHSAGAKKLKGSLTLDSREGALKGGDTSPALVPGDPAKSLLVKAVRWTDDDLRMPPKKKLSDEQIDDLEAWIKMGAPFAGSAKPVAARKQIGLTVEQGRKLWAYQVPKSPELPSVRDRSWAKSDIDRFILARLEAEKRTPAPPADRPALLRRLSYDLVGLSPTPEEVDAFVKDPAPDAYERIVDRLLASRQFGERWGRHWLDVVRFAESLTLRGFIMKEAWRYRDYVIDAFNADLPYDRFVREQIAGDLLPAKTLDDRRRQMVAAGFLILGNTNLEEQDKKQLEMDVVDEQLDTIGRAILGQTIGCARCHDHKFDPIPTRDYYALAGILKNARVLEHANVSKWFEAPLPADPAREAELKKHEEAIAALQARIKAEREKSGVVTKLQPGKPPTVVAVADVPGVVVDDAKAEKVGVWKASTFTGTYIGDGYVHDDNVGKGEKSLTFHPELAAGTYEVRFAYSPGTNRATNVPVTILSAAGEKVVTVNEQEHPPIDGRFVSLGRHRFENNQGYIIISNEGTRGHVTADAVVFLREDKTDAPKTPVRSSGNLKELEEELKRLEASGPKREMVMAVREEKEIGDIAVHIRGSVHTLGEKVPRGFLHVATDGPMPELPARESGRRELAEWLASPSNPLTARVFVNRAWHWLFGAGIVRTTDNFGTTGEVPSHPELLDHLAVRFAVEGYSTKKLVREIVLSNTYRMTSAGPLPDADPENRLLGKANRRRLDAECLRDSILQVSGRLRLEPPKGATYPASLNADYGYRHSGTERSVYAPVFRNALPELFEVFDFGDASVPNGRRDASTVAPQALYLMNNPFVLEQAKHAAARLLSEQHADDRARVVRAYRLALGRSPTEAEREVALRRVAPEGRWASLFHALFASIEFRYVD